MLNSLYLPFLRVEFVLKALLVGFVTTEFAGLLSALYTHPITSGMSGLPSMNVTITSMPTRGMTSPPHPALAQF